MKLDDEAQQRVLRFIEINWSKPRKCHLCHAQQWNVHSEVYEIRSFAKGGLMMGGPVIPVVAIECIVCGNTHLLNAIKLGVVSFEDEEEKNE